ncbi:hypothetical protein HELRODRAFT_165959 [Helobdella robusta]|uniref:Sugar phosphate transporter domain-containing protein n=1 Tax=Helobdella robusta TaxID=6412 RepID=T1EXI3_HELRO|nr:hypothetical protein HELRODRAFT_165959 [Helobdella robusta]ESN90307.1 hypothetical protein HELRODRAFT_165959 [Helobdella robusta]
MMYHIQPWMILSLLPLSSGFEAMKLATSEQAFAFQDEHQVIFNMGILLFGAVLAFMLEYSEFMVVSQSSGLTLSIAGIFKEVLTLLLAAFINGDEMSLVNAVGLLMCLAGIVLHVLFKYKQTANYHNNKLLGDQKFSLVRPPCKKRKVK